MPLFLSRAKRSNTAAVWSAILPTTSGIGVAGTSLEGGCLGRFRSVREGSNGEVGMVGADMVKSKTPEWNFLSLM